MKIFINKKYEKMFIILILNKDIFDEILKKYNVNNDKNFYIINEKEI